MDDVLCPHCGLYIDPAWGPCAHDPTTPDWLVKARILSRTTLPAAPAAPQEDT